MKAQPLALFCWLATGASFFWFGNLWMSCPLVSHPHFYTGLSWIRLVRRLSFGSDNARPRPEESIHDYFEETFVFLYLFLRYFVLVDMTFLVLAVFKAVPFGMPAKAHLHFSIPRYVVLCTPSAEISFPVFSFPHF